MTTITSPLPSGVNDLRTLSEESLRWNSPTPEQGEQLRASLPHPDVFREFAPQWALSSERRAVFYALQRFQATLHEHMRDRIWKVHDQPAATEVADCSAIPMLSQRFLRSGFPA